MAAVTAVLQAAGLASAANEPAPDPATFSRTTGKITLDGRLDESSWRSVSSVTTFFETYPANLGAPAEATTATFLYDDRNIYVAIRALDHDPASIRSPIVRRDQVLADQDYVEVMLDPLNTRRSAFFFRVNARGVLTDGQYDNKSRIRDYAPDFDFDAAAAIDDQGWTAEIRIPLSSLRYQTGVENRWAYVLYRNLPRQQTVSIASAPIPRGENCDLCYASVLDGIAVERSGALSVIPHITYERLDESGDTSHKFESGIDLTWKPRESTVVDVTIFPDFSQIEADAPQLTANTQFALALIEKRPFFLEGTDLLSTQVPVIYTRSFTDPDAGVRITDRSARHEYTALALRDAGGGTVIEPGPLNSRLALQDFESTALVARDRFLFDGKSVGMLATARFNDDGSQNVVIGADSNWTPSPADQITAQFLSSQTQNPNRPDLLETWTGQRLDGSAGSLAWTHSSNDWYANLTYEMYSRDFRAWNGFVTQVGVSSLGGYADSYSYPHSNRWITRYGPRLVVSHKEDDSGGLIYRSIAPGIVVRAAGDTLLALYWQPHIETLTLAGPRTYESFTINVSSTPFPWMPGATLSAFGGERVDNVTGIVGHGYNVQGNIPVRISQLEVASALGYQTFRSDDASDARKTLLTERNRQVIATWHFSPKLNLRITHQETTFEAAPPFAGTATRVRARGSLSSLLLSYQTNWQTRYYLGAEHDRIFAKVSYAFSN
jgi:uncharacterized protein DUF5916/cellulose/xylan binding protein with CBM9 domain